jgi:uncharacterized membrane protein YeaQ/YmgE (transglycosylase-associated protein family)
VLFLAVHPVTGGCPVLAVVRDEDIDLAAQAVPVRPYGYLSTLRDLAEIEMPAHPQRSTRSSSRLTPPDTRPRVDPVQRGTDSPWKAGPPVFGFIIAGLIIGALARLVKPGKQNLGIIATLLLGLVGSVIGGVVANLLGTGSVFELNVIGFIVAVIAAVLLIGAAETVTGNKSK